MAPVRTGSTADSKHQGYSIDHLISTRARNRSFRHFGVADLSDAPAGFKPHPKPLALSFGKPNEQHFPYNKITAELANYPFQDTLFKNSIHTTYADDIAGTEISNDIASAEISNDIAGTHIAHGNRQSVVADNHRVVITRQAANDSQIGLDDALQYGEVQGLAPFRKFVRQFVQKVNPPGFPDWDLVPTNGSGDGLAKAADAIIDPGDVVLLEEFTFTPFINAINSVGGVPVPTKLKFAANDSDSPDFDVDYLDHLLTNWNDLHPNLQNRKPKAIYVIPTSQNPTGLSHSVATRQKVYDLAVKHDFFIIEDDPYGYLQFPALAPPNVATIHNEEISIQDYLENHLYPSYLQFDTQGRVLRLETVSKVLAPGFRLGFIVAHTKVINAIKNYASVATRAPSGVSQLLFINTVQQGFGNGGVDGYLSWILKMRLAYTHRRNVLINQIVESRAHSKGYLTVPTSNGGMFAAVKLNFPAGVDTLAKLKLLNFKFLQYGVSVVFGAKMAVDIQFSKDHANFLRICFAASDNDQDLAEAGQRLADAVENFFENGLEY